MTSTKRFLGEPPDTRWLNRLNRFLTVAGFGSAKEQPRQFSGWDVTICARSDALPGEPRIQVATIYSFDYFGVQRISSVVIAVDEDVETRIVRHLTKAGFSLYGSPDAVAIAGRLVHAGFSGKHSLGHDLVHPQFLERVFQVRP